MQIDELFANHLYFMANHRGSVRLAGRDVHVEGPTAALTSFVPGSPASPLPEGCKVVRLAPWSGDWSGALEDAGFRAAECLTYMEYGDRHARIAAPAGISVDVVDSPEGADVFAEVQSAGFATGEPGVDEWWRTYFGVQARANFGHPEQTLYLGRLDGRAITSTLVIRAFGVMGIYAVATLPEYRRRGGSAAVLERVRRDALAAGCPRLILQAASGSVAERHYAKLGFTTRYASQVWRR